MERQSSPTGEYPESSTACIVLPFYPALIASPDDKTHNKIMKRFGPVLLVIGFSLWGGRIWNGGKEQLRCITKFTQIRTKPTNPDIGPPARNFVRLETGSSLINMGLTRGYRDFELKETNAVLYRAPETAGGSSPQLPVSYAQILNSVRIDLGPEDVGYMMRFKDSPLLQEAIKENPENVTVSVERAVHLFGPLRDLDPVAEAAAGSWLARLRLRLDRWVLSSQKDEEPEWKKNLK